MVIDKEYFDHWMQAITERLDRIEQKCGSGSEPMPRPVSGPEPTVLPNGERLLDNQDLCLMLRISKRTLQRYRSSGALPYYLLYRKTYYKECDVLRFIEEQFDLSKSMKCSRTGKTP